MGWDGMGWDGSGDVDIRNGNRSGTSIFMSFLGASLMIFSDLSVVRTSFEARTRYVLVDQVRSQSYL
jgi:hypothetical protein